MEGGRGADIPSIAVPNEPELGDSIGIGGTSFGSSAGEGTRSESCRIGAICLRCETRCDSAHPDPATPSMSIAPTIAVTRRVFVICCTFIYPSSSAISLPVQGREQLPLRE